MIQAANGSVLPASLFLFFILCGRAARRRLFAVLSALALLLPAAPAVSAGKAPMAGPKAFVSLSLMEKSRKKGDSRGFRMELQKLLEGPAKDFFFVAEKLFDPKRRKKTFSSTYHFVLLPGHSQVTDSFSDKIKRIVREEAAMAQALLPPLGKWDQNGRTPAAAAARSGNLAAVKLFSLYEAPSHEIYEGEKGAVWDMNPEMYPAKEDNIWSRRKTPLEETAAGLALLKGDFDGFLKALSDLYEGPAWEAVALPHSRETKTGKTIFHLLAEARLSLSEIIKPAVLALLKESGMSNEAAEKHSQWLSDNIGERQRLLKNKDFQAAQAASNKIYFYLSEMHALSDDERNDLLSLGEPAANERAAAEKELKRRQAQAAAALENLIEAIVPSGLSGFWKDQTKTKAAYMKAMLFNGGLAAASFAAGGAAYDINVYMIGTALALTGGYASMRCYRAFKSYKSLTSSAPAARLSAPPFASN